MRNIEISEDGNRVVAVQKNGGTLVFERLEGDLIKTTFKNMRGVPGKWTAPAWLIDIMTYRTRAKLNGNGQDALNLAYGELSKEIMDNFSGSEMMGKLDMLQNYCRQIEDLFKVSKNEEK